MRFSLKKKRLKSLFIEKFSSENEIIFSLFKPGKISFENH